MVRHGAMRRCRHHPRRQQHHPHHHHPIQPGKPSRTMIRIMTSKLRRTKQEIGCKNEDWNDKSTLDHHRLFLLLC